MSNKVLVRKQNETPPPDAYINPENTGQGNTVGMSGGGQGAFLNVDAKRRNLSDPRYTGAQRFAGRALRGLSALGAGIGAASRFSGSEEDAISASLGAGQDAYTTYGTTAGVERALIPGLPPKPEEPKEKPVPSAPDVAVLDAQNNANTKLMLEKPMEKKPVVADSTMRGIDDLLNKPSMEEAVPAQPVNPVKVVDSNQQISSERARLTGEKPTDKQGKYEYGETIFGFQ